MPAPAALATFQGVVAEFIPIVGTYIAGAVPLVIAYLTVGMPETLILLVYILIYQQVENYLLAPRLQSRTMAMHPAMAFGAALAGGAIGGLLWAFLAIPFAATVQASASLWIEYHEVVETELTAEHARVVKEKNEEGGGRGLARPQRRRVPPIQPGLAPAEAIRGPARATRASGRRARRCRARRARGIGGRVSTGTPSQEWCWHHCRSAPGLGR